MTKILLAAPIIEQYTAQLQRQCLELKQKGVIPSLKVILVGDSPASLVYTQNKKKFCEKIGASCEIIRLSEATTEKSLVERLKSLAQDSKVHGIIVQLPLPPALQKVDIDELIPPHKDVDGFHPINQGALLLGKDKFHLPCTPQGILTLIQYYKIPLKGQNVVVIGRSNIVGKPVALLLLQKDATVTLCHSHTQDLASYTKQADIVVSAVGRPQFLNKNFFDPRKNTVVIDVGINRDNQGKLCGDVHFDEVKSVVGAITPVPGGIGPLTILCLAQNLLQATENSLT